MSPSLAAWLLRLAGVGHEMAARIDRADLRWARPGVLVVGLLLLPFAAWWISHRHRERMPWLSPRQRLALDVCRTAVLGLLVFVLAGPSLRLEEQVRQPPVVAIVVDVSDSMSLPVGPLPAAQVAITAAAAGLGQPAADDDAALAATGETIARLSRSELVGMVLAAQEESTLRPLRDRFDLRRYEVARRPRQLPDRAAGPRDPGPTAGPARPPAEAAAADTFDTALGAALEMAMDDAADRGLAAIVLMSDGRSTTGIDPVDAVRRATEAAGGTPRGPVLAVPVGSPDPLVDVAVTDLLAAPEVAVDDTVAVVATLQASGLAGREATVELRDGTGAVIDSQRVTLRNGRQQAAFTWRAARPGTQVLAVSVPAEPEETVRDNNAVEASIDVSDRRLKALVIDHAPRWDLRFLDHAIRRDMAFSPTVVLTSATGSPRDSRTDSATSASGRDVPADVEGWADYDIVLLGDVPASALDADRQRSLVEAVTTRGVGLVLQPGTDHLPREYAGGPLAAVFPVEVEADPGTATLSAADFQPLKMLVTARGAMHPAFALSGDAASNRRRWSDMPPFFLAAGAKSPTPAATVLAEVQAPGIREPRPLVVEAPAGNGRVLWIGTDETFRWRRNLGDQLFWRFWGQSLRSVGRRPDRPADATWLAVSPARCEPGSPVLIELSLVDTDRKPVVSASQTATVTGPSGGSVTLQPGGRPGLYVGVFTPESVGRHRVGLAEQPTLVGEVTVAEPGRERAQPSVDRDALEAIADVSGGTLVEIGDFASLPQRLAATSVETRATFEDDLWDTWPVLVLLVGLFCVDVGIRRLSGSS
jgi:hypothetical protein